MSGGSVWRAQKLFTGAALVLACAGLVISALLYARGSDTRESTRATVCSIGSFLTRAPIIRARGVSRKVFVGQLVTTGEFLRDLRGLDCSHSQLGRAVTADEVREQLRRIRRELKDVPERLRHADPGGGGDSQPPTEPVEPDHPSDPPTGPPDSPGPPATPGPPPSVIQSVCDRVEDLTRVALPAVCR